MNILDTIIAQKRIEVAEKKISTPIKLLEQKPFFKNETLSLKDHLLNENKTGIIAEYKRRSPSKGIINDHSTVDEVTEAYEQFGASAISVLTDEIFFGGGLADLEQARKRKIPLLRKDFMIDEYQIIEAKAFGADIILLIAACLSIADVKRLASFANNIGLNVLLEIHGEDELNHICDAAEIIGINNRNLKNFEVDIHQSIELGNKIPGGKIKIAESGITNAATIALLKQHGFNGFLIGERFMKEMDPGKAFREFTEGLQ